MYYNYNSHNIIKFVFKNNIKIKSYYTFLSLANVNCLNFARSFLYPSVES